MFLLLAWLSEKLAYARYPTMVEKKLDQQEFDQILKKYTSELSNPLQGVSFSVFNIEGGVPILH